MSKKMGLGDGLIIGGGFFLGYFLAKCLVAIVIILTVLFGMCSFVARREAESRHTDLLTHTLAQAVDTKSSPPVTKKMKRKTTKRSPRKELRKLNIIYVSPGSVMTPRASGKLI